MQEQLISFETAKLAKDKGFDWLCKYAYDINKKLFHDSHCNTNWNDKVFLISECSAPTQSLLQKWLREKHRIHVTIISCMISSNEIKYYIFKGKLKWNWNELFNSYEDAFEAGLFEALKLINNEDQKTI